MSLSTLMAQASLTGLGLAQAVSATALGYSAGRIKALADNSSESPNASASGRLIGGLVLPTILSLGSLYLARSSFARLSPKLSIRKVSQLDPKLAWPTLTTKLVSLVLSGLYPFMFTTCLGYSEKADILRHGRSIISTEFAVHALHVKAFKDLKAMWDSKPIASKVGQQSGIDEVGTFKKDFTQGLQETQKSITTLFEDFRPVVQPFLSVIQQFLSSQQATSTRVSKLGRRKFRKSHCPHSSE